MKPVILNSARTRLKVYKDIQKTYTIYAILYSTLPLFYSFLFVLLYPTLPTFRGEGDKYTFKLNDH